MWRKKRCVLIDKYWTCLVGNRIQLYCSLNLLDSFFFFFEEEEMWMWRSSLQIPLIRISMVSVFYSTYLFANMWKIKIKEERKKIWVSRQGISTLVHIKPASVFLKYLSCKDKQHLLLISEYSSTSFSPYHKTYNYLHFLEFLLASS